MSEEKFSLLLKSSSERSIDICRELIKRPSEDPPGDTRLIASYIHDLFQKHGIEPCSIPDVKD